MTVSIEFDAKCVTIVYFFISNLFVVVTVCRWTQTLHSGNATKTGNNRMKDWEKVQQREMHFCIPCSATTATYRYMQVKMPSHSISCAMMLLCVVHTSRGLHLHCERERGRGRVTLPLCATLIGNGIEKYGERKKGAIVSKGHTSKYLYDTMRITRRTKKTTEMQTAEKIHLMPSKMICDDLTWFFIFILSLVHKI